uniref:Uncharacterized protein n=1 Tax=Anguilla anguilla TaxID=7936 RepID=A0A0E9T2X9_ANGAN
MYSLSGKIKSIFRFSVNDFQQMQMKMNLYSVEVQFLFCAAAYYLWK